MTVLYIWLSFCNYKNNNIEYAELKYTRVATYIHYVYAAKDAHVAACD